MRNSVMRTLQCLAIVAAGVVMAGCPEDNDGPLEDIGEEIEDTTEELDNE